jgi:hypothetical protein
MPERIYKLQPDRTLHLRGFDTFAAAATIHHATPTGWQISGMFRDPADFAVAVLYDADNFFEHPSIKYLPDFDFAGLTLDFSLRGTDSVQPIDSPKFNWIDWATLDVIRADGSIANVPLWEHAMLADSAFPAASATVNVVVGEDIAPGNRITLWHGNLAFDYTVPGGRAGSATYFFQDKGTTASISVGATTYTYHVTTTGGESGAVVAAGVAAAAAGDPLVSFTAFGNVVNFVSRVNTGGVVNVSGFSLWLITDSPATFLARAIASQINSCNWAAANTTHGLLASSSGAAITVTAARYGTVHVSGFSVTWASGTKFSGITPGSPFVIAGTTFTVASIASPTSLTLTTAGASTSASYLAPRGGRDGNMIRLYTLANTPDALAFDQATIPLAGGSSEVTWNVSLDFSALGIGSIRQCWLTFAPSLTDGAPYSTSEWQATFSNWTLSGPESVKALTVAGPGSVRIEENDTACTYTPHWSTPEAGFYSKYFARAASVVNESVTIEYTCQFTHDLYLGTSLYVDRGVAGIRLDGDIETLLDCRLNTGSAVITRRLLRSAVAAGAHTVTIRVADAGVVYFDFLEAAVRSDVPDALAPRTKISPALDFDTDHTYKLAPARLMWIFDKLGYAGPINEYLGVFWWNQRTPVGGSLSTATVTFTGAFVNGDSIILHFGDTDIGKSVFPTDTVSTIAHHFAAAINGSLIAMWASAEEDGADGVLTLTARSPAPAYNLSLTAEVHSTDGTAAVFPTSPAPGVYPSWVVDDAATPPIAPGVRDWHADFFAQCASRSRDVITALSMELVNPPDGYVARYPNHSSVATATGFGSLVSNHCAAGSSRLLAYQKAVYRDIARMQSDAGLIPRVQFGEFLWWYSADPAGSGMAFYDDETTAAASAALGRALHTFMTTDDEPMVNSGADALFLRNRLRDHVNALISDLRSAYPAAKCELLWPYDVNYPTPLPTTPTTGGRLNRYVNLPVEWQTQSSSNLDAMKIEALGFATGMRSLDLARETIWLFPGFGWPLNALRYLVPVFGSAIPWEKELDLVWGAGLPLANLWAFDHVCLFNLDVPERMSERRSFVKSR